MALFKDGVADDLSDTISVDKHKPKLIFRAPLTALVPVVDSSNNGEIYYLEGTNKFAVVENGVLVSMNTSP